jgi:hypothetical protein
MDTTVYAADECVHRARGRAGRPDQGRVDDVRKRERLLARTAWATLCSRPCAASCAAQPLLPTPSPRANNEWRHDSPMTPRALPDDGVCGRYGLSINLDPGVIGASQSQRGSQPRWRPVPPRTCEHKLDLLTCPARAAAPPETLNASSGAGRRRRGGRRKSRTVTSRARLCSRRCRRRRPGQRWQRGGHLCLGSAPERVICPPILPASRGDRDASRPALPARATVCPPPRAAGADGGEGQRSHAAGV